MALSWKSFDFFEASPIKIADDDLRAALEGTTGITSLCAGSGSLFLGSRDGFVRIVSPSWKVARAFEAYDNGAPITHIHQVDGTSLLVTVAEGGGESGLSGAAGGSGGAAASGGASPEPVLKVWALDRPVKKTGLPTCLSTVTVHNSLRPDPITAFAATDDLSQVAVGFANGAVTVIRGDLIHDRGTKQRIVHESATEPVTGVELHVDATDVTGLPAAAGTGAARVASTALLTTLFVATTSRVLKLVISGKGQGGPPRTVEDAGCGVGCMTVDRRGDQGEADVVVVARDDAIYYYTLDGRGAPTAFEGPKKLVAMHGDYIALVSPQIASGSGELDVLRRRFLGTAGDSLFTFSLLQPDLRIIAHTESLLADVRYIFQIWGDLFTLTQDGKIFRYHEKTIQQRLEMLYQRNLYTLAVELAQKSGLDAAQQNVIFKRYGDYLYAKGSYDQAMAQYVRAIDVTEPSAVIRRFLDTQRIHNLIEYLEELHELPGRATSDHTTLLLNCYAKLKDVEKLEKFIKSTPAPGERGETTELKFDLDTAIAMCRQGGYYEQAAYLAKKHGETDLVVDILIEDSKAYREALGFIWQLDPETAYPCLMKYAVILIEHCSSDATRLLIDYYTGKYKPKSTSPSATGDAAAAISGGGGFAAGAANAVHNLGNLMPLPFMNSAGNPGSSSPATAGNAATTATTTAATTSTRPPLSTAGSGSEIAAAELKRRVASDDARSIATTATSYAPPAPRTAFSCFIDHPDQFIVFLEACVAESSKAPALFSEADRADLYTALFEMYLHKSRENGEGSGEREEWETRAKALLVGGEARDSQGNPLSILFPSPSLSQPQHAFQQHQQPHKEQQQQSSLTDSRGAKQRPIDSSNILLLSHLAGFSDGTRLVQEQSGLLFDIFRSYTSARDTHGALRCLRRHGPAEPRLYPAALAYLTSDARVLAEAGQAELEAVLDRIDRDGLMAPLQVVQALSGAGGMPSAMGTSTINGPPSLGKSSDGSAESKDGSGAQMTTTTTTTRRAVSRAAAVEASAAKPSVATMGMIKPYLARRVERERRDVAEYRRDAAAFAAETARRRHEMAELTTSPAVFQATRCAACGAPMDLPAVHFLCKHSFHQRCLRAGGGTSGFDVNMMTREGGGEGGGGLGREAGGPHGEGGVGGDVECPVCATDKATIRALKRSQDDNAGKHELFRAALEASEDRFRTIAEWFGRGVMGTAAAAAGGAAGE